MACWARAYFILPGFLSAWAADTTGINLLKPEVAARVDAEVRNSSFTWVKTSLVYGGQVVYEKAYGANRLGEAHIWASISKTATAMITLQLLRQGRIRSLDDNVWDYATKYASYMPEQYAGSKLTLRHILTHTSGIPHYNAPTFVNGKFNLQFRPGTQYFYSTHAFGVLGEALSAVAGKDFNTLVKEYIGAPAGASSFRAENQDRVWRSPAGFIFSSSKDMGLYAAAVMKHLYVSQSMLYDTIARTHFSFASGQGLGWRFSGSGTGLVISHSGSASDGSNQSTFLRVLPRAQIAAGTQGVGGGFSALCSRLTSILLSEPNPLRPVAVAASPAGGGLLLSVDRSGGGFRFRVEGAGGAEVFLSVFRPDGRAIWNGRSPEGGLVWVAGQLPAGVYLVSARTGAAAATRRITLDR